MKCLKLLFPLKNYIFYYLALTTDLLLNIIQYLVDKYKTALYCHTRSKLSYPNHSTAFYMWVPDGSFYNIYIYISIKMEWKHKKMYLFSLVELFTTNVFPNVCLAREKHEIQITSPHWVLTQFVRKPSAYPIVVFVTLLISLSLKAAFFMCDNCSWF